MDGNGALVPVSMKGRESPAVVVDELGSLSFLHRRFGCDRRQESLYARVHRFALSTPEVTHYDEPHRGPDRSPKLLIESRSMFFGTRHVEFGFAGSMFYGFIFAGGMCP
jgi:hypothetical protein